MIVHSKKNAKKCYTLNSEMYLYSEMNLKSAKIYLESSNVNLNLRKRMIKF